MVCEPMREAADLLAVDQRIAALTQRLAQASAPEVVRDDLATLVAEVDARIAAVLAHEGDHSMDWIVAGAPDNGPTNDALVTAQTITAAWNARRAALAELEERCQQTSPPKQPVAVAVPIVIHQTANR
jgi:hypothetical protein